MSERKTTQYTMGHVSSAIMSLEYALGSLPEDDRRCAEMILGHLREMQINVALVLANRESSALPK
jgi:hypothetical protein